jgi:CDP-glucose 4,6-dehydratase
VEGVVLMMVKNEWPNRRVLVTGASGFVGSWLVKALIGRGAYVVVLIRDLDHHSELVRSGASRCVAVVNGCLEDYGAVERGINEFEVDTVFHLGAQAIVGAALRNPLPTFEANIRGTYYLLEACRVHSGLIQRVVIASSDKAYGDTDDLPYTEKHPLVGRHPYDVSKSCTDLLAASYYHTYRLPVAIARCGNIYGGGDLNWSRIVPGTIRSFLRGERPILRSDGTFIRDYFYVEDAVGAYLMLAEQLSQPAVLGQAFNFSNESNFTVRQIVETLQSLMGAENLAPVILGQAQGEIVSQTLSAQRARTVLGWSAKYGMEEGLKKTIAWYRAFLESAAADQHV